MTSPAIVEQHSKHLIFPQSQDNCLYIKHYPITQFRNRIQNDVVQIKGVRNVGT